MSCAGTLPKIQPVETCYAVLYLLFYFVIKPYLPNRDISLIHFLLSGGVLKRPTHHCDVLIKTKKKKFCILGRCALPRHHDFCAIIITHYPLMLLVASADPKFVEYILLTPPPPPRTD